MTDDNRRENLVLEIERGETSLRAARTLVDAGLWDDAVSRAYYAAFHWLRAVLFTLGQEPRTHAGTHDLFFQHFVTTGVAPRELAKLFSLLQKYREQADYARAFRATEADAREQLAGASQIRDWVERHLLDGNWITR